MIEWNNAMMPQNMATILVENPPASEDEDDMMESPIRIMCPPLKMMIRWRHLLCEPCPHLMDDDVIETPTMSHVPASEANDEIETPYEPFICPRVDDEIETPTMSNAPASKDKY